MKKLFILFIVVAGFGFSSFGQESVAASAKIIVPVGVSKGTNNIDFGSIVPGLGGTVSVSAAATAVREASGVTAVTGSFTNAVMTVSGETSTFYKIHLSSPTVTLINGSKNMVATILCDHEITAGSSAAISIATNTFYIGASLAVGTITDNPAGSYTTTTPLSVTVVYE